MRPARPRQRVQARQVVQSGRFPIHEAQRADAAHDALDRRFEHGSLAAGEILYSSGVESLPFLVVDPAVGLQEGSFGEITPRQGCEISGTLQDDLLRVRRAISPSRLSRVSVRLTVSIVRPR
jgi:hypothetical protein